MMQALPQDNFKWLADNQREAFVKKLTKENPTIPKVTGKGFIAEVDIELPPHLWDKLNEFPLAPENRVVHSNELSQIQVDQYQKVYQKMCQKNSPEETFKSGKKLIADLHPKNKFIIHHEYLKLLLEMGYKITKVHRVMTFCETRFMKDWIALCTKSRAKARNEGDKAGADFWKLAVSYFTSFTFISFIYFN